MTDQQHQASHGVSSMNRRGFLGAVQPLPPRGQSGKVVCSRPRLPARQLSRRFLPRAQAGPTGVEVSMLTWEHGEALVSTGSSVLPGRTECAMSIRPRATVPSRRLAAGCRRCRRFARDCSWSRKIIPAPRRR